MNHSTLYLRLAEGSGEAGPDQRSKPRQAFALLCAFLILMATPVFFAGSAVADSGSGHSGSGANDCATREDNSGPGSCDDDEKADDDTDSTTSNRRGTTRTRTTTGGKQKHNTTRGKDNDSSNNSTTSNRRGTTRTGTSTGSGHKQLTTTGS